MKKQKNSVTYRPFEKLKDLLKERSFPEVPRATPEKKAPPKEGTRPENEVRLFLAAMDGVEPLVHEHIIISEEKSLPAVSLDREDPEPEVLKRLRRLIHCGEGFVVSHTPEYMEGLGYGVRPDIARRLHRGDFSIQGHIDLHGYLVEEAKEIFEAFLRESIEAQKRAVLVVHGRGLSSRDEPVLKTKVKQWLTSGPWRKWVIAFTSARACDGGAGATYVLLRKHPVTKRFRKKYRKNKP